MTVAELIEELNFANADNEVYISIDGGIYSASSVSFPAGWDEAPNDSVVIVSK